MESNFVCYLKSGIKIEDKAEFSEEVSENLKEQYIEKFKNNLKDAIRHNASGIVTFSLISIRVNEIAAYWFE